MHDSDSDTIQPATGAQKCVAGISHSMEEHQGRPLKTEGLNCNLVAEGRKRTRDGPIMPLDPGLGKPQDFRVEAVEKTIRRPGIQPRRQFDALIAVNQSYRDNYSTGGFLVLKIRVKVQRTQSTHPPANGSCSSGETKIRKGEEMPLALTSS